MEKNTQAYFGIIEREDQKIIDKEVRKYIDTFFGPFRSPHTVLEIIALATEFRENLLKNKAKFILQCK